MTTDTAQTSSLKELQDLIQEKYGIEPAELDPNASMREKGFDSLALVEFVFAIEDHFGISMPDDDPTIDTLAQLAALVDKVKASQSASA
ncbi:acyl carrier protein [Variovorax ureilyticus]|uniref:Acyl carrier protein n=1 Tax=Variovorax ureilyticus TaxID=1836198 RepID=A0ABU8VHA8_9BURK